MTKFTIDGERTTAKAALLAAAVIFFLPNEAAAQVCGNPDQSVGRTIHDALVHNPAISIEKFTGSDAQAGIDAYNLLPEPGDEHGDTFYIAFDLRTHLSYMAVSKGDCLVSNGYWLETAGITVREAIKAARGPRI
jgi:hypothetical protein